jgi:hypothetical protein
VVVEFQVANPLLLPPAAVRFPEAIGTTLLVGAATEVTGRVKVGNDPIEEVVPKVVINVNWTNLPIWI